MIKLEIRLEIKLGIFPVEMVFEAMSLNEVTKEVSVDRKEKSRN